MTLQSGNIWAGAVGRLLVAMRQFGISVVAEQPIGSRFIDWIVDGTALVELKFGGYVDMAQFRVFLAEVATGQRFDSLNYICLFNPAEAAQMRQEAAALGVILRIISIVP